MSNFYENSLYINISNTELDDWYNGLKITNNRIIFLFGIGNGVFLKKILDNTSNDVVVIEPDNIMLRYLSIKFKLIDYLEKPNCHVYTYNENTIDSVFKQFIMNNNYDNLVLHVYPKYEKLFYKEYNNFKSKLQLFLYNQNIKNKVIIKFGKSYVRNIFNNISYLPLSKSYDSLKNSINTNLPVFIISSGPSLDYNINELKNIKDKGYIISVDSALKPLLVNDIIPDLVVSVDSLKNKDNFNLSMPSIPLLTYLHSNYELLNNHNGDKIFIDSEAYFFHIKKYLKDANIILPKFRTGGSVSCTAFSVAQNLGFKNIVFVGLDLAYMDNKAYSKYALLKDSKMDKNKIVVKGNYKKTILSTPLFNLYKKWFEDEIKKDKSLNVINATYEGSYINGCKLLSLKEAISTLCTTSKKEIVLDNIDCDIDYILNYKSFIINNLMYYKERYLFAKELFNTNKEDADNIIKEIENSNNTYNIVYYITYRIQKEINDLLKNMTSDNYIEIKYMYIDIIVKEIDTVIKELYSIK